MIIPYDYRDVSQRQTTRLPRHLGQSNHFVSHSRHHKVSMMAIFTVLTVLLLILMCIK